MRFVLVLLFASTAGAQEIHCRHFYGGMPSGTPATNDLIFRDVYVLSSNNDTKFADWVAYQLTPQEVFGTLDLDRKWRNDPWLEAIESLEATPTSQDDYRGASAAHTYDRGHLAPLASFKGSRHASQVNFYSNIVPQKHAMNAGPWSRLEDSERSLTMRYDLVWVMTGPLYERDMPPLPNADEEHRVPSGFWKIVVVEIPLAVKVAGFVMDQDTPGNGRLIDQLRTIRHIESLTGLDFFTTLGEGGDDLEGRLDSEWVRTDFRQ